MEASYLPQHGAALVPRSRRLLSALGDARLVEHVRRGSEVAFEVIYDRHHRGVLSFCRHMLGSREEAEDALQHTFIAAYASLQRSERPVALKAWLYTIARNRCLSVLRGRREHSSEEVELSTAGLAEDVERRAELRQLLADLAELPEQQRGALVLSELGDLTHADIAAVLGCEAGKVKSLVFQARSSLIDSRRAREIPCEEIRGQLATVRGGALRRGELRRHVKACPGCAEYREEVRRQRAMMAAVLPVLPSLGLRDSALAAVGLGAGGGGGAAAAGGIGGLLSTGAAKVAVVAAVAGGAGGVAVGGDDVLPGRAADAPSPAVAPAASQATEPAITPRQSVPDASSAATRQRRSRGFSPERRTANGASARDFAPRRSQGRRLGPTRERPPGRPAERQLPARRQSAQSDSAREPLAPPASVVPESEAAPEPEPIEPLPTDYLAGKQLR